MNEKTLKIYEKKNHYFNVSHLTFLIQIIEDTTSYDKMITHREKHI